ncbi:MAG TPA: UDP-N-acetylmuramate dehydrogenase, partial [Candidatus Hydrogenedentes bacterium]|nr:UDP-N-acetylmuramate dehydrogenase [Candidatus Hydrogenedentota bacterium]
PQSAAPRGPRGYCCGSVFKNPPGDHAGRLIEACGLKGARRGGAVISPMHANFIMNENNAGFDDIVGLIQLARSRVREQFGVELEPEVRIIR